MNGTLLWNAGVLLLGIVWLYGVLMMFTEFVEAYGVVRALGTLVAIALLLMGIGVRTG